jgi:hypothetical protein
LHFCPVGSLKHLFTGRPRRGDQIEGPALNLGKNRFASCSKQLPLSDLNCWYTHAVPVCAEQKPGRMMEGKTPAASLVSMTPPSTTMKTLSLAD